MLAELMLDLDKVGIWDGSGGLERMGKDRNDSIIIGSASV